MDPKASQSQPATPGEAGAATRRSHRPSMVLVVCIAVGGVVLSSFLYLLLSAWESRLAEARFRLDAEKRVEAIHRAFDYRLGVVQSLGAFFAGSNLVERREFRTFTKPSLGIHSGTLALGWAPAVPSVQRSAHIQAAREEGFPQYQITERDSRGELVRAGARDEYFPVFFLEVPDDPGARQPVETLLGFDLGANPECLRALQLAHEASRLVAAPCTGLVEDSDDRYLLCVVAPTYGPPQATAASATEQRTIGGFVLGLFWIDTIVRDALGYYPERDIDVCVFDQSPPMAPPLFCISATSVSGQPSSATAKLAELPLDMHHGGSFPVANRRWTVDCAPTASYFAADLAWGSFGALVGGLLLTGLLVGYLILLRGRTAHVERLVAARTAELNMISSSALDAVVMMDPEGKVAHWNPAAEKIFGYRCEEILGRSVHDTLVPEKYREEAKRGTREFARHGKGPVVGSVLELEALHKDGSEFPVEIAVSGIHLEGVWWAVAIIRDITERRRAEEAVRKEQRLLRQLLNLQERERKLVAYDIHDGLAQKITGALLTFQAFARRGVPGCEEARAAFENGMQLLDESLSETRRLISGLRPPVLDESGIIAAIDLLISEHQQRGGPQVEFAHDDPFDRLAPPLETAVFRIVQECLTNACRHSQSERVRVELAQIDGRILVKVEDWGIGFDPATVEKHRFGLQGIQERARLLGGKAEVESVLGKGTRIAVELPLLEETPDAAEPSLPPQHG